MRSTVSNIVYLTLLTFILLSANCFGEEIQRGDYLGISVIGDPEFSRIVQVQNDGSVLYPYIQGFPIQGMTPVELQTLLVRTLQIYIDNPVILVEILSQYTIRIQVLGQVNNPGIIEIPADLDIQSSVSIAGGLTQLADPRKTHILRKVNPDDDWEKIPVNLQKFMFYGDLKELPKLRENDIIMVPGMTRGSYVVIIGAVVRPGNYIPLPESNLLQVILQAGGISPKADASNIKLLRPVNDGTYHKEILNLDKVLKKDQLQLIPAVKGGDIIIVQEKGGFLDWGNTFKFIRNITILLSLYLILRRV